MHETYDIKIVPIQPSNQPVTPVYPTKISGTPGDLKVLKEDRKISKISGDGGYGGGSFPENVVGNSVEI